MTVSTTHLAGAFAVSLLLASAPAQAAAPTGRYAASGGVVLDKRTGLNWQQAVGQTYFTRANAATYCSGNIAMLPGSGWRLPALKELQTLVDDSVASPGPTIDASAFPSTPGQFFWSSTPDDSESPARGWGVDFANGTNYSLAVTVPFNVRCVR